MIWSTPAAFWMAFSLLAILALHAVRQRHKRLSTTTLHIWRRLAQENRPMLRIGKLVMDWPLALQLLLMSLLVLALAQPLWLGEKVVEKDIVLVVDTSASMSTRKGEESRFDRARAMALELVEALVQDQRMAVVEMAGTPHLVVPFTDSTEALRDAISGLSATDTHASLAETLSLAMPLALDTEERKVVLIGDGAYYPDRSVIDHFNARVEFVPVSEPETADNIGIVQFAYRPQVIPEQGGELLVAVRSFAKTTRKVTFSMAFSGTPVMQKSLQVEPDTQYALVIPVPAGVSGVATGNLEPADALLADNRAYAVVAPTPLAEILLVGDADASLQAALRSLPNVQATYRPDLNWGVERPDYEKYDLLLFNRVRPPALERGSIVVVGEVSPQGGVRFEDWSEENRVTDWQPDESLLRFMDPRQLWLSRSLRLIADDDAEVLVSGPDGPLMVKREDHGVRVVTLGFDLREAGSAAQETFPLLMANLLDWARGNAGGEVQIRAGSLYEWVPPTAQGTQGDVRVTGPGGQFWTYAAGAEPLRFPHTEEVGIYTFESNNQLHQVAVNLLDSAESRIAPNPLVVGRVEGQSASGMAAVAQDGWPLLIILGGLILLIEWLLWTRTN